jgi:AcrR family transcriptional regulator
MEGTKQRILSATTSLFGRQGYHATGIKQIVADAPAPFGSVYHFFPGGKEQLGTEVIEVSGALYLELIDHFFSEQPDVVIATRDFFDAAADALKAMDYADPCPIATVSMEVASTNDALRQACADAFQSWIQRTADYLAAAGIKPHESREVAVAVLATLEGGFMLGRAFHDPAPVRLAGDQAVAAVEAALRRRSSGQV